MQAKHPIDDLFREGLKEGANVPPPTPADWSSMNQAMQNAGVGAKGAGAAIFTGTKLYIASAAIVVGTATTTTYIVMSNDDGVTDQIASVETNATNEIEHTTNTALNDETLPSEQNINYQDAAAAMPTTTSDELNTIFSPQASNSAETFGTQPSAVSLDAGTAESTAPTTTSSTLISSTGLSSETSDMLNEDREGEPRNQQQIVVQSPSKTGAAGSGFDLGANNDGSAMVADDSGQTTSPDALNTGVSSTTEDGTSTVAANAGMDALQEELSATGNGSFTDASDLTPTASLDDAAAEITLEFTDEKLPMVWPTADAPTEREENFTLTESTVAAGDIPSLIDQRWSVSPYLSLDRSDYIIDELDFLSSSFGVYNIQVNQPQKMRFTAGFRGEFVVYPGLSVQSGVLYSQKGSMTGTVSLTDLDGNPSLATYNLSGKYVQAPLTFKFKSRTAYFDWYVGAGALFQWNIPGDNYFELTDFAEEQMYRVDLSSGSTSVGLNALVGAEFHLNQNWSFFLEPSFNYNLSPVIKSTEFDRFPVNPNINTLSLGTGVNFKF